MSEELSPSSNEQNDEERWIFNRPPEILNSLTDEVKWEVTRRHPYYQMFWRSARADGSLEVPDQLRDATRLVLGLIGVHGEFPHPATPFSDLVPATVGRAWLNGAISRVSVRSLSMMLFPMLSRGTLRELRRLFDIAVSIEPSDVAAMHELLKSARESSEPGLDQILPELVMTINPHASTSAIEEAVRSVVQQYRSEHGIPDTRRREDLIPDYLAVWDEREGWNGSVYQPDSRRSLKSAASRQNSSTSTAFNRYQSAFRLIIGHTYNPTRWWRTMGLLSSGDMAGLSTRLPRRINRRVRTPVPASRLGIDAGDLTQRSCLTGVLGLEKRVVLADLGRDVYSLISNGLSNEEICARIRMDWECDHAIDPALIEGFRDRLHGPP